MRIVRLIFLISLLFIISCSKNNSDDIISEQSSNSIDYRTFVGLSNFYIDHDGLEREFLLYIPKILVQGKILLFLTFMDIVNKQIISLILAA